MSSRKGNGKRSIEMEDTHTPPAKVATLVTVLTTPVQRQVAPLFSSNENTLSRLTSLSPCSLFGVVSKRFVKIEQLVLGNNPQVTMVGRVTHNSNVRYWNNLRGNGSAFSFNLYDESGEITVNCFNENVENFFGLIDINQVMEISGFQVKVVNGNFVRIRGQPLEIILGSHASVTFSDANVPEIPFHFVDINGINEKPIGSIIELLCMVYESENLIEGVSAAGKNYAFRVLSVTDKTKFMFHVKIWDQLARDFKISQLTCLALRNAKIEKFQEQKALTIGSTSLFWLNPEIQPAVQLSRWLTDEMEK